MTYAELHITFDTAGAGGAAGCNNSIRVVGYVYQQLTADSYPTAGALGLARLRALGSFESGVASVGGEAGYLFTMRGKQAYFNVRGYSEFWAPHRPKGYALFGTISIPLGG